MGEWIKKTTLIKCSKARAWIQIYDAIVKSGVTWRAKHMQWTKLRAIAGVLDRENAGQWIEMASNHSKAEITKLVQGHWARRAGQKPNRAIPTQVKTVKFHNGQIETVQAAIERAKEIAGAQDDSAALEVICHDYVNGGITTTFEVLQAVFAEHLSP